MRCMSQSAVIGRLQHRGMCQRSDLASLAGRAWLGWRVELNCLFLRGGFVLDLSFGGGIIKICVHCSNSFVLQNQCARLNVCSKLAGF